jgi:von Willebrand factor type A domain
MGLTFLTPLDALFALAAAVPLAAMWLAHSRMEHVRRFFSLKSPRRREFAGVVASLAILPALMGVAAAQPVVVRRDLLGQRFDVQAFFVFDTSSSMSARTGPQGPTRLERAKREGAEVVGKLGDIPVGVASMTDRVLPDLMPTSNLALFRRTLDQSVGINRPPPSQWYAGRATTFAALYPIANSNFYSPGVQHRILVVFTDGESAPLRSGGGYGLAATMTVHPLFVHTWAPTERIYVHGRIDPRYAPDPTSAAALSRFASAAHGRVFGENDLHALEQTIREEAGRSPVVTKVSGYARVALAPWFVLAGIVPLGFLLYRRNL